MKGINSFDENGYWSRYSNDNWSVRKIYDDVLGYEYTLSGESFDALEVVDKLASLESELAARDALIERMVEAGSNLAFRVKGGIVHIDKWDALVEEWEALKGGEG